MICILSQLNQRLREGEKVLWSGKPEKRPLQMRGLMFLPIALIFLIVPIAMTSITSSSGFPAFTVLFDLFTIIFFLIFFGSIIFQFLSYENIEYMVTDQRILIQSGVLGVDTRFIGLAMIQEVSVSVGFLDRYFGTGTLTFKTASSGFGGYPSSYLFGSSFIALKNPYEVQQLLDDMLNKRRISKV